MSINNLPARHGLSDGESPIGNISIQYSLAEFAERNKIEKPHEDVIVIKQFFEDLPLSKVDESLPNLEFLPFSVKIDKSRISLARATLKGRKTGNKLLDQDDSNVFYIFVNENYSIPFAELGEYSSEWTQPATDGVIETLSPDNQKTVRKIIDKMKNHFLAVKNEYTSIAIEKRKKRKRALVGIGVLATFLAMGAGIRGYYVYAAADDQRVVESFDKVWGDEDITPNYYPVDAVNAVQVSTSELLRQAPKTGMYDNSVDVPRLTYASIGRDGSCSTTYNVPIEPNDLISVVQFPDTTEYDVSYKADSINDSIIFCSFPDSETESDVFNLVYDIKKPSN